MNKIVNGVANDYEFSNLYDPNISYSKAYTEQLLAEKDKEIERLNNIIDKIFEWMQNKYDNSDLTGFTVSFQELQDLKELKEGKE